MSKLKELLFLQQIKGIGVVTINETYLPVVQNTSNFEAVVDAIRKTEKKVTETDIENAINVSENIMANFDKDPALQVITVLDENYPNRLRALGKRKPIILYAKGNLAALKEKGIAVVGTRHPQQRTCVAGRSMVEYTIKHSNPTIISGLALGCDEVAHTAALELSGITIAVLPSGFNHIIPLSNKKLAQGILDNDGCLLSEYDPDVEPMKSNFVRRDSIVAALASGVIVLECTLKSGTMYTAEAAFRCDRPIGCYLPAEHGTSFDGNEYIINNMNGTPITKHADLGDFLDQI